MKRTFLRCACIVLSALPACALAQKTFDFRGLPLGISLNAFRRDEPARATPPGSVAVCDTDIEAASLGMVLRDAHSLSIACKWAHRSEDGWRVSQAVVDGAPARDHVLRFMALPGDASPRLYRMSFVIDARVVEDFTQGLTSRFGRSRVERANGYRTRTWENATSSITLEANGAAASARVIYRLKSHEAWLRETTDKWRLAALHGTP
ncbi:hypothetical protein AWB79_06495 [Caballeronia hypogeia]|uniref:Lipoprotein n=1 Tax=Caballeronia hypogeia TaxID=1777140 RepID=A0A158D5S0_9BURK|nr:hypothetical protein [Caballeronia hypogeia]SAK89938.1 hypothetical protein AWB79_06495 [Caballeronia hypogeia]